MAEEKITIPVSAIAAYVTVIATDLMIKLGYPPSVRTVRAFRKATTSAIRNSVLERAPEDFRDQVELLRANETAKEHLNEQGNDHIRAKRG